MTEITLTRTQINMASGLFSVSSHDGDNLTKVKRIYGVIGPTAREYQAEANAPTEKSANGYAAEGVTLSFEGDDLPYMTAAIGSVKGIRGDEAVVDEILSLRAALGIKET